MIKNTKGMTLIEVLLVVILVSILAAIIIPRFSIGSLQARVQSCEMNRAIINTMIETWYFTEGTWPKQDLQTMKTNKNYFPDGIPTCPVDQTSYTMTVTNDIFRVSGHREGAFTHTW